MFLKIFYNLIKRQFTNPGQTDIPGDYIPYFQGDDSFPNKLAELVDESPTATACISTTTDFITGEGFNDEALEDLKVDAQGTTFFQVHEYTSDSMARNKGLAWLIRYNQTGSITEIIPVSFSNCRLGTPDKSGNINFIIYNPYFGTRYYKASENKKYPTFDPKAAIVQMAGKDFYGQILWYGITTTRSPFYPLPDYYSAKSWMRVEAKAGIYFEENLENGFLQPSLMKIIGDPNDPSGVKENENDPESRELPKGELLDNVLSKNFAGAERVGKLWVFWGNNKDEFPTLEAFPSNNSGEMIRTQDEHAIKKITIATKVPGVLANINDANNFSGEQIRPAVALMQQRVSRPQSTLIHIYESVLKNLVTPYLGKVSIVPYNPFPEAETMDPQVWAELSTEERRKWITDHTEVVLIEPDEMVQAPVNPDQPQARVFNLAFNSYPETASNNVKRAQDWMDKMSVKCGGKAGLAMADKILKGENLSSREIKRLSNYLSKNALHKDKAFDKSCSAVEFNLWGGVDMMVWANNKVKEIYG